jgi:hypothetical protein
MVVMRDDHCHTGPPDIPSTDPNTPLTQCKTRRSRTRRWDSWRADRLNVHVAVGDMEKN